MSLKTGKAPATYDARDLKWADLRPKSLVIPRGLSTATPFRLPRIPAPHGGFGMDFTDWGMLGNGPDDTVFPGFEGCGDCVWAGAAHEEEEQAKNSKRPIPTFSGATVVQQYGAYSGYDPQSGANDNGSIVRDVYKWRQKKGLVDDNGHAYKMGIYLSIEPGNFQHMWECLWFFEKVGIGIIFPQSAMDQFNAGQMWSVVAGSPEEGGHYVPVVGHPYSSVWTAVTWAKRQTMTPQFLTKYNDEAWTYIDHEMYSRTTGQTFEGWRDADLEKFINLLLKQFPQ